MCGISGALSTRRDTDLHTLVTAICDDQVPRGPDARAVTRHASGDAAIVLGHNRLSILDLRPEANQPMASADGELTVVFNGEIYNFLELRSELEALGVAFRTRSDTEVLLAAYRQWGDDAFDRFIGMFALALYDARARELVLVRDRFGVKPLYYWTDGTTFAFASTPRVIARWAGLAPDIDYVARGIRYRYYEDDTDRAPYVGLHSLEPSHLLRVRWTDGRVSTAKSRYYDLDARTRATAAEIEGLPDAALEERLLELLRSACMLRQRSDVPLGLSVSGGLDSSLIAALVSEQVDRIVGYSFGDPNDLASEGPLVAELARATRLEPRFVSVEGRDDLAELFWATLRAQDAPFPHASIMAQHAVFRAARADGTTVLLGGQGGDEAFMGYRKFFLFYAQSIVRERRATALPHLLSTVLPLVPAVARRAALFAAERHRYTRGGGGMPARLVLPATAHSESMGMTGSQGLTDRQRLDVTRYSIPTLLRYEDRNSMGNSVETRLPFMDQRVVEFGLALPPRLKLGEGFGKLILRRIARGRVPDSITRNRDKRGFDVNQRQWLTSGLGAELRGAVEARRATIAPFLPPGERIDTLFSDERLATDGQAFKEAVSLIWLGDRL
ncbi:MAG: asparagine synthase (glutamine-hydrolyzing) [Gemmatirosa sp.]